jgi:chromate transporter
MKPSIAQSFAVFLRIGLLSFGGPAAQIALMHRMLVEENQWLTERQYLNALSFCMLLPGPEAMQLATYAGWRLHGIKGGIIAGLLFVIPGAIVIFALATLYVTYGDVPLIDTLFLGIKAAVLIIVLEALLKVSKRALKGKAHWIIAALAFVGIFFFSLPFPLIVLLAAIYGAIFTGQITGSMPEKINTSLTQTLTTIAIGLALWFAPILLLDAAFGTTILSDIGIFFSKLAIVTFGGAYAVLAYMAQDVVTNFGWLTPEEMMDGLGLAETTPGPLILVTQFVGYIAGFRDGGLGLAFAAASLTLWVTFIPCFIWIFVGAPYIDWISTQSRLTGALQAITAAVVGVILNLSIWFGLHVLFGNVVRQITGPLTLWVPDFGTLNWTALLLSGICGILLLRAHLPLGWVLAISATTSWAVTNLF